MNFLIRQIDNQNGSTIVMAILFLALLTIIGIAGISTSNTELQTAASEQVYKMAFFAAEAGRSFVVQNPDLYHDSNLTISESLNFPDLIEASNQYNLAELQSINGTVEYQGSSPTPRGSGFEAGDYRAHNYRITSNGYGPRNSVTQVEEGFYRIGF